MGTCVSTLMPRKKTSTKKRSYKTKVYKKRIPRYNPEGSGPEEKQVLVAGSLTVPDAGLFSDPVTLLNAVGAGTSIGDRVGNRFKFTSLELRYTYYPGVVVSAVTPNSRARIIVLFDKQANGALPLIPDIFVNNPATAIFVHPLDPTRIQSRFLPIADIMTELSPGESDTADRMTPVSGVIRRKFDLTTIFRGTGATIAAISEGSFILLMAGNSTGTHGSTTVLQMYSKLQFTDV
ncbi:MAG: capsid protein [Circoviridae sp.]|nr:MAG: capsid protein [Circoviridae sp.]